MLQLKVHETTKYLESIKVKKWKVILNLFINNIKFILKNKLIYKFNYKKYNLNK